MPNPFDLLIDSYVENKVGIDVHFLDKPLSLGLQQHMLQLQRDNLLTTASIGNNMQKDAGQTMRRDKIYWMDKSHAKPI